MVSEPTVYNTRNVYKGTNGQYVEPIPDGYYNFGGIDYPYKKINNLLWTIDNLYWDNTNIQHNINGYLTNTPVSYSYGRDDDIKDVLGYLYNWHCIQIINNNLSDGWRVCTRSDVDNLSNFVNGHTSELKNFKFWQHEIPNDKTGFKANPSGQFYGPSPGQFDSIFAGFYLWTSDDNDPDGNNRAFAFRMRDGIDLIDSSWNSKNSCRSIRLCKDV